MSIADISVNSEPSSGLVCVNITLVALSVLLVVPRGPILSPTRCSLHRSPSYILRASLYPSLNTLQPTACQGLLKIHLGPAQKTPRDTRQASQKSQAYMHYACRKTSNDCIYLHMKDFTEKNVVNICLIKASFPEFFFLIFKNCIYLEMQESLLQTCQVSLLCLNGEYYLKMTYCSRYQRLLPSCRYK